MNYVFKKKEYSEKSEFELMIKYIKYCLTKLFKSDPILRKILLTLSDQYFDQFGKNKRT
jgi:hypothetical protein